MITVEHLTKEFTYYRKATGLRGSLHNIFHRESLTKEAVRDISFSVEEGEMIGFLGPNGAGKTTTLKMILNLVSPDHGKVYFEGKETTNDNLLLLKNTGVLLEGSRNMFWSLSPLENFIYWSYVCCYCFLCCCFIACFICFVCYYYS